MRNPDWRRSLLPAAVFALGWLFATPVVAGEGIASPNRPAAIARDFVPPAADVADNAGATPSGNDVGTPRGTIDEPALQPPEDEPCDYRQRLFDDRRGCNWLDEHDFRLYGWLDQSLTWNPHSPETRTNGPVTFTDRANEYQLNQFYLVFERTLDQRREQWQAGGRLDLLYGTDYFFTTARGLETEQDGSQRWNPDEGPNRALYGSNVGSLYGLAMPQLYAEIAGHDLSLKIGHFYTILEYEQVTAPSNFFVTHSYSFQYNPFTHTGILGNYRLNDRWDVSAGLVQGADRFDEMIEAGAFLGGIHYTNKGTGTNVTLSLLYGKQRLFLPANLDLEDDQVLYSLVIQQQLTPKLQYVLEHNVGRQQSGVVDYGSTGSLAGVGPAEWYGINQYLFYQVNDRTKAGVRFEWFRDDDGYRIVPDRGANYYEAALGFNRKLASCVLWRNELRWDWTDKSGIRPFDLQNNPAGGRPIGKDGSQMLFTTDLIVSF
jgi:hypothetical protein